MNNDFYVNPAKPQQRQNYMLTNLVSNFDDLGTSRIRDQIEDSEKNANFDYLESTQTESFTSRLLYYINLTNPVEWIFLLVFSVITTSKIFMLW